MKEIKSLFVLCMGLLSFMSLASSDQPSRQKGKNYGLKRAQQAAKAGLWYRYSQRYATGEQVAPQELQEIVHRVAEWAAYGERINVEYLNKTLAFEAGLDEEALVAMHEELKKIVDDLKRGHAALIAEQQALHVLTQNRPISKTTWHTTEQFKTYIKTVIAKFNKVLALTLQLMEKTKPERAEEQLVQKEEQLVPPALPRRIAPGAPALPERIKAPVLPPRVSSAPALPERAVRPPELPKREVLPPALPERIQAPALPPRVSSAPALPERVVRSPELPKREVPESILAKEALRPTPQQERNIEKPSLMEEAMARRRAQLGAEEEYDIESEEMNDEFASQAPEMKVSAPVLPPRKQILDKPIRPTKEVVIKTLPSTEKGGLLEQIRAGAKLKEVGLPAEREIGKRVISDEEKRVAGAISELSAFQRAQQAAEAASPKERAETAEEWD